MLINVLTIIVFEVNTFIPLISLLLSTINDLLADAEPATTLSNDAKLFESICVLPIVNVPATVTLAPSHVIAVAVSYTHLTLPTIQPV